jgi:hypothetical protein
LFAESLLAVRVNSPSLPPVEKSPVSVLASTAAKKEQQKNNQQEQSHGNLLSVAYWL